MVLLANRITIGPIGTIGRPHVQDIIFQVEGFLRLETRGRGMATRTSGRTMVGIMSAMARAMAIFGAHGAKSMGIGGTRPPTAGTSLTVTVTPKGTWISMLWIT
jgi:hypothetical protein